MTVDEVAHLLRVSSRTILRWTRQGLLPTTGKDPISFDMDEVTRWAAQRSIGLESETSAPPPAALNVLAAAIERGTVCPDVQVHTATDAIAAGIGALTQLTDAERDRLLREVLDRERMASTALGSGIAIPHPRNPVADLLEEPVITVVYLSPVIDWAAPDQEEIHTALLVLSPRPEIHLKLLAKIARAIRSPGFCTFLSRQPAKAALVEHVQSIEFED